MKRKILFLLLLLLSGEFLFSQTNDPIKNYDGIPILPYLETIADSLDGLWYSADTIDSIEIAGVPMVQVNDISEFQFDSRFLATDSLKILPAQDGLNHNVTHNAIRYYTRAIYSVWEAEGTNPDSGDATLYFDSTVAAKENGAVKTKDGITQVNDTLIYGPYYAQLVFYTALNDYKSFIPYRADFRLKIDTIGTQPPNPNDTICILQVTTSHVDPNNFSRFDSTFVIDTLIVLYSQLSDTFQTFSIDNYTYSNVPTLFTSDISQFRAQADYIQFKVIWKGNSNKVRLYIDKVTVSDNRGRELISGIRDQLIIAQINADLQTFTSGRVAGWDGAGDELGFIDQFEPIRYVQNIVDQNGGGRGLWLSAGTGYNGRWGGNVGPDVIDPFGSYSLFTFEEFYKRVGKANIWSDYYLYGYDDGTYEPYEYRDIKIKYMLDSVNGQFNKPNVFWGASVYTGKLLAPNTWLELVEIGSKEFLYNINVHLLVGAKVISPYPYFAIIDQATDHNTALVNAHWNFSPYTDVADYCIYTDKWYTLKDTIAPRLNGLMGKTLKKLTPVKHYLKIDALYPESTSPYEFVNYIQAGGGLYDTCLIELGIFQEPANPSKKYFMPVNRYYSNKSRLTFGLRYLTGYNNWQIYDYVDTTDPTPQ